MGIDESSKGVVTPGVSATEGGQTGEIWVGGESLFRAVAARGNYLGQDRMDMQFAAKEISRFMSKPEEKCKENSQIHQRQQEDGDRI